MAKNKKKKNIKHTEAIKRKAKAAAEMAKLGLKLDEDRAIIGCLFNHLAVSHLTYLGLNSINQACRKYAGLDICIFTQHIIPSCIPTLCPIFNISDLIRWHQYPLITTSIETTIKALASNAPMIYHYAFDPEFINKPHKESEDLTPAFCDSRVCVIVRHESHKELIESEFNINVCDTIIQDYDIEQLTRLVLTEIKNGYRN